MNFKEGKTAIDIGNLDALQDADKVQLLEALAIAKQRGTKLTSLVRSVEEAKGDVGQSIKLERYRAPGRREKDSPQVAADDRSFHCGLGPAPGSGIVHSFRRVE